MPPEQQAAPAESWFPGRLLWIDGGAGTLVGVASVLLAPWVSAWYAIDLDWIYLLGGANLAYGAYALMLASRTSRSRAALYTLIFANFAWSCVCLVLLVHFWSTASFLGLGHLVLEALFVAVLAAIEWRYRAQLTG